MKKLILLTLIFMVGMFFTLPTLADARVTINGNAYDISNEDSGFNWTGIYNNNAHVLTIYPSNSLYLTTLAMSVYPYGLNLDGSNIEQFMLDVGIDIQSEHTTGINYFTTTGFTVSKDEGDNIIRSDFNYLKIETSSDEFYYPILDDTNILTVLFKVNYDVSYDDPLYVVNNNWQTNITINGEDFPYPIDTELDWSMIKFSLINVEPEENKFLLESGYRHWYGINTDAFKTGFYFTENYFLKYIEVYLEPFDNDDPDLLNLMIADYIEKIRTVGMTVSLPVNYGVEIFVPSYFLASINYWRQIDGTVTTINIKVPDLVLDGSYESGELWGNTLIYTVGGIEYNYSLVDEYNNTIPPIFGFRISADYWQITFDENGGSAVDDIYIGYNQLVYSPTTTRTGWVFKGWTTDMTTDYEQPWDSEYVAPQNYQFPFRFKGEFISYFNEQGASVGEWVLNDVAFQAIWAKDVVIVSLELNGGQTLPLDNFQYRESLVVEYGESANDNVYEIPFSNMVYRLGYSLVGWYQDEALTIPFNPITPLTSDITIYAKWLIGTTGDDSPTGLNAFMDHLGLLNDVGTFFAYLVIVILFYIPMILLHLPSIIYLIINITISALWAFLGWFNGWTLIIVILANIVLYKLIIRGE